MTLYITNAFSISMLDDRVEAYHDPLELTVRRIGPRDVRRILAANPGFVSAYGHALTAGKLERLVGQRIEISRKFIRMIPGDRLIVAQCANMPGVRRYEDPEPPFFIFHLFGLKSNRHKNVSTPGASNLRADPA